MGVKALPDPDDVQIPSGEPTYIVMYSGGLSSYEAARRCIEKFGPDRVELWFADTNTEDPDLYRFNDDVERLLGKTIRRIAQIGDDGEELDIWGEMERWNVIANSMIDQCSSGLKRRPLRQLLRSEFDPDEAVVVIGFDNIEDCNRIRNARHHQRPYATYFPLLEGETPFKSKIIKELRSQGVEPPRLYTMGFKHNNCGGFCVKAGLGQMAHLLRELPEVYAYHEEREQRLRNRLIADGKGEHGIFKRQRNGKKTILTLRMIREEIESGQKTYAYEEFDDSFSCSCFTDWFKEPETP